MQSAQYFPHRFRGAELLDQPWFPEWIRRPVVEYLTEIWTLGRFSSKVTPLLQDLLSRSGRNVIIDLCSGGGGPLRDILPGLATSGKPLRVICTDLFPEPLGAQLVALGVEACTESVDARNVPQTLSGVRTLFNAFHHFGPEDAHAILADAREKREPIFIAEIAQSNIWGYLGVSVFAFLGAPLLSPFIRPYSARRVVLSTLIPLIPLALIYDGIVSCLRAYTQREIMTLLSGLSDEAYRFSVHHPDGGPGEMTVIVGCPQE